MDIVKEERNERGLVTYRENSLGAWEKWEYDANGNKTHYETSNGYWVKTEFNANGKLTYYENSKVGVLYDWREQTKAEAERPKQNKDFVR